MRPGSDGEHELQERFKTVAKADAFYNKQMLDYTAPEMIEFIKNQKAVFIATSDGKGECDCSPRFGEKGFITVFNNGKDLIFPDYKGQGVMANAGNILENQNIGLCFINYGPNKIGLHVNGGASVVFPEDLIKRFAGETIEFIKKNVRIDKADFYIHIKVREAYIHCSKHIPTMKEVSEGEAVDWGTEDPKKKGGDYFNVKNLARPWVIKK